ncbi:hypothetical protein FM036_44285 [Nostoc sp. HG1]|nr:hypothetical protein [Nostoc sp. HG1]
MIVVRVYHHMMTRTRLNGQALLVIDTFDELMVKLFRLQALLDGLSVLLTSMSIIRLLKYCDFAANLVRIKATIQRCFGDLIGFLVMFVAIMVAFAQVNEMKNDGCVSLISSSSVISRSVNEHRHFLQWAKLLSPYFVPCSVISTTMPSAMLHRSPVHCSSFSVSFSSFSKPRIYVQISSPWSSCSSTWFW